MKTWGKLASRTACNTGPSRSKEPPRLLDDAAGGVSAASSQWCQLIGILIAARVDHQRAVPAVRAGTKELSPAPRYSWEISAASQPASPSALTN
jgi:hypothetical protein